MHSTSFNLRRNRFGKLVLTVDGVAYEGVTPVRAFPLQTPFENIALVNTDGREVAWINNLNDTSSETRQLITDELASREFIPEIQSILSVSSFSTPSTWNVLTDRGQTSFVLRAEEDIRQLGERLLITDNHGIHYLIQHPAKLDRHGKKILDRFL